MTSAIEAAPRMAATPVARLFAIAIISFLTLVDLFATQAILPSLAAAYRVSPGVMGSAVNLCTLGMAVSGLGVALFSHRIGRRKGVTLSLALLTIPTLLLALMPDLTWFAALRLLQGVFMSAAFSLTIAYIAETASANVISAALAAYVTGNVASNLFGRLMSAAIADHLGLPANFLIFAGLNLAGAALAYLLLSGEIMNRTAAGGQRNLLSLFRRRALNASFAIGFLILFVFIGAFTYVNFVLTRPPLGLSAMQLGFVYLIFIPSIIATPFAGVASNRLGAGTVIILALLVALLGLAASLIPDLTFVLGAMTLLAAGTDGTDGPTDAAGAIADVDTVSRGRALGLDAHAALETNDAYGFFRALGDLVMTGPTGTNLLDLYLVVVE